ncbi:polysaccharide deacetylase familiy protein [Deinococcus cellulosilyticus NBRC 106333 = KACC 11606]|uniref:Polysaccharide deacetylase familiy protein n=1 Tax=Deinococcus cellulosilyticus (strain DSM 18568 / NBRC 106333 / KACC 11606 / 5516J-15) TaxID=1223518 RepID=A0A511N1X5_DEIC1|nr:polysaccharide deacetylase familiy protein [Deinococcus cellulosilyticus NBRC 106333 = KACC 11606]
MRVVPVLLLLGASPVLASSTIESLSAAQPSSPGHRPAAKLPELVLKPAIAGVKKIQYFGNGHIEVAGALVLVPQDSRTPQLLKLAQQVAKATLNARLQLNEVDISIHARENFRGFGGPAPLLTASVPRARLKEFLALSAANIRTYERVWLASEAKEPALVAGGEVQATRDRERAPLFQGTVAQLIRQLIAQRKARRSGETVDGIVLHGNPGVKQAALTFDDAVHPIYAPLLLDSLRMNRTRATFFVVGRNVFAYPYFLRDLVKDGHEIGNHTYHHIRASDLTIEQLEDEIVGTNQLVRELTGQKMVYFRPPGGWYSLEMLMLLKKLNLTMAFWTNDPSDVDNLGAVELEKRFLRDLHPGGIVLLHDNAQDTILSIGQLIQKAKQRGIALVPLGELMSGTKRKVYPSQ